MKKHLLLPALFVFSLLLSFEVQSATFIITSNTNWSGISGGPPSSNAHVTVKNGATLTIDVSNAICAKLYLGGNNPTGGDGTIAFNSGSVLTVTTGAATVQVGTFAGIGYFGYIDMTNGGKLICNLLGHAFGTFTPGSGTLEFQGTTTVVLKSVFPTYNNLINNNTGTLKLGVNTVLTGDLNILQGTFDTDISNSYGLDIAGNINIAASASLNANNSVLTLKGDFINNGIFSKGNSTLTFDGTGAQKITGSTIDLYEFILNKSSGILTLDIDVDADKIQLNNGNVAIGNYNLNLGITAVSGGGSSSYVVTDGTGYLSKYISSTGTYTFHLGDATNYTPYTMTINSATFSGSDSVTVRVTDSKHSNMGAGDYINRYWTVDAGGFTALNYDVSYVYVDTDISGTEVNLKSANWNGSIWIEYIMVNAATNTLFSIGGITSIPSGFSFSGGGSGALPIELGGFSVEMSNGNAILNWITMTENNNDYFIIERSTDGISFDYLQRIEGAGNSLQKLYYSYTDIQPKSAVMYYRLSQTDFNGITEYFPIVAVQNKMAFSTPFKLFPNPINSGEQFYLNFSGTVDMTSMVDNKILVVLIDQMGRELYSNVVIIEEYNVIIAFDTNHRLAPGIYFVIGSSNNEIYRQKLIIK